MSHAELTAHRLYDTMQLGSVSEEVKRHLMILMLSNVASEESADATNVVKIPLSYEEALNMGAQDVEFAREDLHAYVDKLTADYNLQ